MIYHVVHDNKLLLAFPEDKRINAEEYATKHPGAIIVPKPNWVEVDTETAYGSSVRLSRSIRVY